MSAIMDIDFDDILHSQCSVTQFWFKVACRLNELDLHFLAKLSKKWKTKRANSIKSWRLYLFCPKTVISGKYSFNRISTANIHLCPSVSLAITEPRTAVSPAEDICQGKYKLLMGPVKEMCQRNYNLLSQVKCMEKISSRITQHFKFANGCSEVIQGDLLKLPP